MGVFLYADSSVTSYIKESYSGNGFAFLLWSTENRNTENMHVITAKICLDIPVRQLQHFRYFILIF